MSTTKTERRGLRTLDGPRGRDLFEGAVSDRLRSLFAGDGPFEWAFDGGSRFIRVEEYAEGGQSVIRAELPGIDPDKDVDISVEDGVLRIRAVREERSEEKQPEGYRSEFRYGTLVRSFALPEGASIDDVHATYKDGILEIRVPTPPSPAVTAPQKVAVERA